MRLHCVEEGEGPLIVLLHGFPESWYSWRKQIAPLAAAGFHVVAPDLRGYNQSPRPEDVDAYRVSELVVDVVELITEKNGGRPCVLAGHDWGGVVAWFLAMTHPELIGKLVILNSPHPVPYRRELRRSRNQRMRSTYQLIFGTPLIGSLAIRVALMAIGRFGRFTSEELRMMKAMWREPGAIAAMQSYYRALLRHRDELRSMVRRIDVSTLLIWGERDPVFIRATTEDFAEWVPQLRVERIADAGHFVQTDAPERVTELLIDFAR